MTPFEVEKLAERWSEPTGITFLENIHREIASQGLEPTRYYRFLYYLAQQMAPRTIVELGTALGHSTAHLAYGCPSAKVYTIDCAPEWSELDGVLAACPNIEFIQGRTEDVGRLFKLPIDLLFMDSSHSDEQCRLEYQIFRPKMNSNGVILIDDLWYGTVSEFWREVPEEKFVLDVLHRSGFGVIFT